ncbi:MULTISPECIES: dihydrodipicolinate synthase family protein [Oceanobacillus]|uniref:Putative 2-keto-3-deoxy-galactonate aldolase YagE n=2 Tax=Oceanobacillus oncorhynchi TaxID=545501 RepID=A0A0A1MLC3_9BACI|nr:dihydrodipicolinate synthase family protein [Oceanobacillus oncorhynchi]CEI80492.1 putative 2-keto-3-deoxy-galactonate aldolase YagE [Oceanobacillus oncorhynchi]
MDKFSGIIPPVVTPISKEGNFDQDVAKLIIDYLIDSNVDSLFFLGSIGEFSQMSLKMKEEITDFVVNYVNKRVPVLIGTGSNTITESIHLSKFVEKVGGDGVVSINPYYFKLNNVELLNYFESIADSISIPMILYNFPDRTGQDLSPSLIKTLVKRNSNIVGIKETVNSITHIKDVITQVKNEFPYFSVLCGYDEHLTSTLFFGGDGGIIGTGNIAPELFVGLYEAFKSNDLEKIKIYSQQIIQLTKIYNQDYQILSVIKEGLKLKGFDIQSDSLGPYESLNQESKNFIERALKNIS